MNNKLIVVLLFVFAVLTGTCSGGYVTDGGVTVENNKVLFYDDYAVVSTEYVYNNAGGTSTSAGWVPIRSARERLLQYKIENVVGTVTIKIEGTLIDTVTPAEIYTFSVGTMTSGFVGPISEDIDEIRCGAKVTVGGSGNVTIRGKFFGL